MMERLPVSRNVTLDFLRGAAILGILLLNINAFGLPKAAYLNPAWYGSITGPDAWTWAVIYLFARGSRWIQMCLTLLALLGVARAALLWDGDILLPYALVGLVVWRFIRDACTVRPLFNTARCFI